MENIVLCGDIPLEWVGQRLDQTLARLFPEHSRSRLKTWIEGGKVCINNTPTLWRPKDKVKGGEQIEIRAQVAPQETHWGAEDLPSALEIVYEDDDLLILNKPAGLVVHPGTGNTQGTLVNALLHRIPALNQIPRAGVVHRLDKDTTGLLVVAKTLTAHTSLITQLQNRTVKRIYEALVWGVMPSGGTHHTQMGRHPIDRSKMAVVEIGKEAITHYRVTKRFLNHTQLEVQLETGRTHQIRVHMAHLQYPIVGDKTYGGRTRIPPKASTLMLDSLKNFQRQALHAKRLVLVHPTRKEEMGWEVSLPEDFENLLKVLLQEEAR